MMLRRLNLKKQLFEGTVVLEGADMNDSGMGTLIWFGIIVVASVLRALF